MEGETCPAGLAKGTCPAGSGEHASEGWLGQVRLG